MHRLLWIGLLLAAAPAAAAADDPAPPPPPSLTPPPSSPPSLTPPSDPEAPPPPPPSPPPAAAPVEHGYLGAGPSLGVDHFFNMSFILDGGLKLPDLPLWVRGAVALGTSFDFEGGGPFRRGGIGLEARSRTGSAVAGFVSAEVGYQTQTWEGSGEATEHHRGVVAAGRAGLDVGGTHLRFRLALELSRYRHLSSDMDTSATWVSGVALSLGLAYRL